MPDHKLGSNHTFSDLMKAYKADPQADDDAHFLLYRGEELLALCLRYKFNPKPGEVWVGDATKVARRGESLAALKDKKALPLYYSPRNRNLYEFKGQQLIIDDTTDPKELAQRKGPVPLSRIVVLKKA